MTEPPPLLPEPRRPGRYAIGLICLGNICRSPTADVVLASRIDDAGLARRVSVSSSGTGPWHVGKPMDPRAAAELRFAGYYPDRHRAQQTDEAWLAGLDLALAMDADNLDESRSIGYRGDQDRIRLFRDFDPEASDGADVPDPYYGGAEGFAEVLRIVERTSDVLVRAVRARIDIGG